MSTASTLRLLTIATSTQLEAHATTPPHPVPMCTDDEDACYETGFNEDGYCDDSGVLAGSALCRLGTDCTDCGPRCPAGYQLSTDESSCTPCDVPNAMIYSRGCQVSHCEGTLFPNAARTACVDTVDDTPGCNNDCPSPDDGYCDDWGIGAPVVLTGTPEGGEECRAGSDCGDCGPRNVIDCTEGEPDETGVNCVACSRTGAATFVNGPGCVIETCDTNSVFNYVLTDGLCVPASAPGCTHDCPGHNGNGLCEDGDWDDSDDSFCKFGTDCGDCEQRSLIPCGNAQEVALDEDNGDQVCIDCSQEHFPHAKTFDTTAHGCVITECDDGYHLIEVLGHVQFCSPYPEGPGCKFDFEYGFDGECDDGGDPLVATIAALGGDCGDCPPRCLHHTELNATTGRCEPCSRPGVLHYNHSVGCVIYSCIEGYELQGTGADAVCQATPTAPTAPTTGGAPTTPTTGGAPTAPTTGGAPTAPTTGGDPTTGAVGSSTSTSGGVPTSEGAGSTSEGDSITADVPRSNASDDDSFNLLWLLLLLLLIPCIIGIAVFLYMRSRKPSSSQTQEKRFLQDDNIVLTEENANDETAEVVAEAEGAPEAAAAEEQGEELMDL